MGMPFDAKGSADPRTLGIQDETQSDGPFAKLRAHSLGRASIEVTEDYFQSVLNVRRAREALFDRHLFSDPAWDIILELYAAKLSDRTMSFGELTRAIDVPKSVISRWISALGEAGVVDTGSDPSVTDASSIKLTAQAATKLAQLFGEWGSAFVASVLDADRP